ncbi:MAG: SpoIVB peptidase, partial [Clostridia bacterium]|nr:SpoIVB peptidase [Clostridia bacterium]
VSAGSLSRVYPAQIKLWGVVPVKDSTVKVVNRRYVTLGGTPFGLRIFTSGVLVTGVGSVPTKSGAAYPAKKAGIKQGDIIIRINGATVTSNQEITQLVENSGGRKLTVELVRDGKNKTVSLLPVKQSADGRYKIGLWVRDSTAGVGTITFVDSDTGVFAGLGHAICDADTGDIMPLRTGDILGATIRGCVKGTSGTPGELCGVFTTGVLGELYINGSNGVYGVLNKLPEKSAKIPVALSDEVVTGKAQIISTVNGTEPKYYDIEITKIHRVNDEEKNMVIKVTDEELLGKTGGIVQGMSGSPIVQNGMLVGAVTHVFVNDPQQGYAIFADTMLDTATQLYESLEDAA